QRAGGVGKGDGWKKGLREIAAELRERIFGDPVVLQNRSAGVTGGQLEHQIADAADVQGGADALVGDQGAIEIEPAAGRAEQRAADRCKVATEDLQRVTPLAATDIQPTCRNGVAVSKVDRELVIAIC